MSNSAFYVLYPFISAFGGIERLIADLASFLHANKKQLHLLAFDNRIDFEKFGATGLSVQTIPSLRNLASESLALRRLIRERNISVSNILVMELRGAAYAGLALERGYSLHVADPPGLLPRDLSKASFSLASKYPGQSSVRLDLRFRGEIVHRLTRRGVRRAATAITMTQRNVNELTSAYGVPFHKVPPGIRIPQSIRPSMHDRKLVRFLSVCRLEPSKRVDAVIESFADLVQSNKASGGGWSLRIVGDGSQRTQLLQLARTRGIESLVEFTGQVTDEQLETAYADSHVFVMPARQGYGLPGLESLARGLQLIVHRESGVTEFLTNTPQVQIIDNFDSSLTEAMKQAARMAGQSTGSRPSVPTSDEWAARIVQLSGW